MGRPFADIFHQDRLIPSNMDLCLKMIRSKNAFCLMSGEAQPDQKVVILDASLHKVKINPSVSIALESSLAKTNSMIPFKKTVCKIISLQQGNRSVQLDNVFLGKMPERIVLGMVKDSAFLGTYTENPFKFEHNKLNYMSLNVAVNQKKNNIRILYSVFKYY